MNTTHPILGIDIGKDALHVGFPPADPKANARSWPTVKIDLAEPRWWLELLDLIDDTTIIAAEPTGHHLLAPVAAIVHAYYPGAGLWLVDHKQTERYRASFVSSAKNDRLDAIALTLIARDIANQQPPRNVRPYNYGTESAVQRLRLRVNTHQRLTREAVRAQNRLDKLAHGLFPVLAQRRETWLRAVRAGAVTPIQIKRLAVQQPPHPAYTDGRISRWLKALANDLPDLDGDPEIVEAVYQQVQTLDALEPQIEANLAAIRHIIEEPPFAIITRRWQTMPGWSPVHIAAIHVATHGAALEMEKDQFCAALGTTPSTAISGDGDRTKSTRRGYRPARASIHMWTFGIVSPDAKPNDVRTYYERRNIANPPPPKPQRNPNFAAARNKLSRVLWGRARDERLDAAPLQSEAAAEAAGSPGTGDTAP